MAEDRTAAELLSLAHEIGIVIDVAQRRSDRDYDHRQMIARLTMWRSRLLDLQPILTRPATVPTRAFLCQSCGVTSVDEDGCCRHCGADTTVSLATAPPATAWQPIETAPKDGREVLVFEAGAVCLASWDEEAQAWCDIVPMRPGPTHWMPLPATPA